jgi:hypothetical protein
VQRRSSLVPSNRGRFVLAYISGKSVLQEEPPDYLRGRVISLQLTLNNVVSLLPTVLAGWGLDACWAHGGVRWGDRRLSPW